MNHEALEALRRGIPVVVSTRRLAYDLKAEFNAQQAALNESVWNTPAVQTWDDWIQRLWSRYSAYASCRCLERSQVQQLLNEIIERDLHLADGEATPGSNALWNTPETAKTALNAWQLCHDWQIPLPALKASENPDHARFWRWANTLQARLKQKNWISPAQTTEQLMAARVRPDPEVVLLGFDSFNALQESFIEYCTEQGTVIRRINGERSRAKQIRRYSFESTNLEWQHIGAWARDKLLQNSHARIGVVTPDIESVRLPASRALREQLNPGYFESDLADPFHFSRGESLAATPLVSSALNCLSLLGELEFKQFSEVFLSGYWGSESEQRLRARAVIDLRRHIAYRFDLFQLIATLSRHLDERAHPEEVQTLLIQKLKTLQSIKAENRGKKDVTGWRVAFSQCLKILGWPAATLNSVEYQALQRWEQVLDEWRALELVCQPMSLQQALLSLNRHCREQVFQARAEHTVPLQIMGVLETAELEFDALWLAGFDEQAWPPPRSVNPFIPIGLQIKAGIPEASLPLQLELDRNVSDRLFTLAEEINYSHTRVQDEIKLQPSLILSHQARSDTAELPEVYSLDEAIRAATPAPTRRRDDQGLPFSSSDAPGGTGLVKWQSACSFAAYARYRLNAGEDDAPTMGMNVMTRGSLLHKTLESLWKELGNSSELQHQIADGTLADLVHQHAEKHLEYFSRHSGLEAGFRRADRRRLEVLIHEWLMLEATRAPFSVEATEQEIKYDSNGLCLRFKLDRIDRLNQEDDGMPLKPSRLILDYKSGKCELRNWTDDRPVEPQIPLYYLALHGDAAATTEALSFAQVRAGECRFVGISEQPGALPDVSSLSELPNNNKLKKELVDWPSIIPTWERRIARLLDQFRHGDARVNPRSSASCQYCEFGPLCRVYTLKSREEENGG